MLIGNQHHGRGLEANRPQPLACISHQARRNSWPPPNRRSNLRFRIRMELGIRQSSVRSRAARYADSCPRPVGTIEGPRLNGRVVANSGGDWALYRPDNAVEFDARYMLEADDGTPIYMINRGFRHAPPETAAKMEALEPVDPSMYYMRVSPSFETPDRQA